MAAAAVVRQSYARVVDGLDAGMISDAKRTVTQRLAESVDSFSVSFVSRVDVQRVPRTAVHSAHVPPPPCMMHASITVSAAEWPP